VITDSHGRGRWFQPNIAHQINTVFQQLEEALHLRDSRLNVKDLQVRVGTDVPDDITIVPEELPGGLQSEL